MNNNLMQLSRIYNTLLLVSTKGEDTVLMGDCLRVFKQVIETMASEVEKEEE